MNKNELVSSVAESAALSKAQAEKAVNGVLDSISTALSKGDSVTLIGFGTFSVAVRQPRDGRNPRTGEAIKIAGGKVPKFKAGKALKEKVS